MGRERRNIDSPSQRQLSHVPVVNTWGEPSHDMQSCRGRLDLQLAFQPLLHGLNKRGLSLLIDAIHASNMTSEMALVEKCGEYDLLHERRLSPSAALPLANRSREAAGTTRYERRKAGKSTLLKVPMYSTQPAWSSPCKATSGRPA